MLWKEVRQRSSATLYGKDGGRAFGESERAKEVHCPGFVDMRHSSTEAREIERAKDGEARGLWGTADLGLVSSLVLGCRLEWG